MAGEFDKDFGYLMPFLDKLAAAAGQLPDPAARAELAKLMSEEKTRWARIRSLLAGAAGQSSPEVAAAASPGPQPPAEARPAGPEPFSFTVGSLRPKRG